MLMLTFPAFAQEYIERYDIFKTTVELELRDQEIQLEDLRIEKVPTVVKVKTNEFCDSMDMCKSYEVLESKEAIQLEFSYQNYDYDETNQHRFTVNFPLTSLSPAVVDELKTLSLGLNTPKKIRKRTDLAKKYFREEMKEETVKILAIDPENSTLCDPESPYCEEKLAYYYKNIRIKLFSVFLIK